MVSDGVTMVSEGLPTMVTVGFKGGCVTSGVDGPQGDAAVTMVLQDGIQGRSGNHGDEWISISGLAGTI